MAAPPAPAALPLPTVASALHASAKRTHDMFHATHRETLPVFPQA